MNKLIPMEHYRELVWQRAINSLLLQVLKEILVDYRQCGMGEREVVSYARAAIAKAEGRQP